MKALLIEKTKQERIIDEVQKKRNLFGLGLTSLIAACGATDKAAENGATKVDHGALPTENLEATPLPGESVATSVIDSTATSASLNGRIGGGSSGVNDARIALADDQRGDGKGPIALFIANGNHSAGTVSAGSLYNALHLKASLYATLNIGQRDLVVSSSEFGAATSDGGDLTGAIYIFWDIGAFSSDQAVLTSPQTLALPHLKVAGIVGANVDIIAAADPEFYQIGGAQTTGDTPVDQADMVFRSGATSTTATNINILWDVTKHAGEIKNDLTVESPGILQAKDNGLMAPSFIKINNNDNYDMLVKGAGKIYILWDVANYHDAEVTEKVVINLASNTKPDHGLLTIKGAITDSIKTTGGDNSGLTDIDGNGINDLAFVYGANTYILFGEKVANRDGEKAISHTVDLSAVVGANSKFYDKTGEGRAEVADPATAGGFFDYNLVGRGDVTSNVGYRFAANVDANKVDTLANIKIAYEAVINPAFAGGALSEEAYWDIA